MQQLSLEDLVRLVRQLRALGASRTRVAHATGLTPVIIEGIDHGRPLSAGSLARARLHFVNGIPAELAGLMPTHTNSSTSPMAISALTSPSA